MMFEVIFSGRKLLYLELPQFSYFFKWRTNGGGECRFIVDEETAKKIRETNFDIAALHFVRVNTMSTDTIEFFKSLSRYIGIIWRESSKGSIDVAVKSEMVGKFIGKGGKNIKAISKHLQRRINVVPLVYFYDNGGKWRKVISISSDGTLNSIEIEGRPKIKEGADTIEDMLPYWRIWVAPWDIIEGD